MTKILCLKKNSLKINAKQQINIGLCERRLIYRQADMAVVIATIIRYICMYSIYSDAISDDIRPITIRCTAINCCFPCPGPPPRPL